MQTVLYLFDQIGGKPVDSLLDKVSTFGHPKTRDPPLGSDLWEDTSLSNSEILRG